MEVLFQQHPLLTLLLILAVTLVARRLASTSRQHLSLPPGPRGWPLIGNALDIPPKHAAAEYRRWHEEYGPLVRLTAFGTHMIDVGDYALARELLAHRSAQTNE